MINLNFVTICDKLVMSVTCPSRYAKCRVGHSRLSTEVRLRGFGREIAFTVTEELHGVM